MKISPLLNDLLTKGALLGGVMLFANVAEMLLACRASLGLVLIAGLLAIASWVVYCYLAYRFTKSYASLVFAVRPDVPHFTYVNGFTYVVTISMLAGVISTLGSYFCLHHVIGYEEYIDAYVKLIYGMLAQAQLPASMSATYEQMVQTLQSQPEPTFLDSLYSGVTSFGVFGLIAGLIIAAFTRRKSDVSSEKND